MHRMASKTLKTTTALGDDSSQARPKRVQMTDIARMAGVSASTVSRALNRSPLVNEETTDRILALVKKMSYTVNAGAKSLRTGTNRTVAVVVPFDPATRQHLSDPFFLSILGRLADALTEKHYDMLVTRVDRDEIESVASVYLNGKAMGIIIIGQSHSHDQLNALHERGVPFVVWGARLASQSYPTVGTDNEWGGYIAARHLIARGRKHLYFLGDTTSPEGRQRFAGFERALAEHKFTGDNTSRIIECPFVAEVAEARIHHAIDRGFEMDGIAAASDLLAMGAINAFRSRGWEVPSRVAVIGYDDIPLSRHFTPALTTVAQPLEEGASALVDAVLAVARGELPEARLLTTELRVRASA